MLKSKNEQFACDSDLDKRIKSGVISDALSLVNMSAGKQAKFEREQRSKSKGRLFAPSSTSLTNVSEKNGVSGDKNKAFGRVETGQRKTATAGASEVRGCLGSPPLPSIPKAAEEVHGTKQNDSDEESGEEDQSDDEPGEECAEQQESVLDPAAQAAIENRLATLLARYSDPSLEKLSLTESRRSGNYQRVFPPNNMEDLTRYLHIVAKTGHLFESGRETLAVRARRDFLQAKKQAVVDKLNFLDDWRVSRKAKQGASKQIRHSRTSAAADHRLSLCEYHRLSSTSSPSVNGSKLTLSFSIEGHNRTLPPLKRTPPARQRMSLSVTNIGSLL